MNNAALQLTLKFQSLWCPPGRGWSGFLALVDGHGSGDHSFGIIGSFGNLEEVTVMLVLVTTLILNHIYGLVSYGGAYNCSPCFQMFSFGSIWNLMCCRASSSLSTLAL